MTQIAENQLDGSEAIRTDLDMGRVVLMHDGEVVEVYNDSGDAYKIGCEKYGGKLLS